MTEINQRLLKLITEDKTLNEISNELNLSNKQIMNRLRTIENNGYNLNRNYYYKKVKDLEKIRRMLVGLYENSNDHERYEIDKILDEMNGVRKRW